MTKSALLGFLLVFGHAVSVHGQASVPMDAPATALQEQADALIQPEGGEIRGARIAWSQWIHEFYSKRAFRPIWTNSHSSQELVRAIEDSFRDGLDPADYHLALLQQLGKEVAEQSANESVHAQLDVLQTDALLRLGYHLTFGKVDPESFDAQWNYSRTLKNFDAAAQIEAALATDDLYARIEALKPTHRLYRTLKAELQRYRDAAAAHPGIAIPAGPTLQAGISDARVPLLRARLLASGDLQQSPQQSTVSADPTFDAALVEAVRRFQERLGMTADGVVGARTLQELNVPVAERILQLRVNLDRGRVLLQDLPPQFVIVNIAGFLVYLVKGDDVVWSARVQVGTPYRRTPIFRSEISYLVLNPTWTVPPGIISKDILPAARRDPESITRHGLSVLDRSGNQVAPASVDWSKFSSGHIPYTLRQEPGPGNSLGRVKFMFPNAYSVYLHDTPSKQRFDVAERPFSSGCVRVERPLELAEILLNDPVRWNAAAIDKVIASEKTQNITLKAKLPVLLAYWTAWVDTNDRVNFRRDIYGQDAKWAAGLNAGFQIRKRPLFAE